MNAFQKHFPGKAAVVLPVIHVVYESHYVALANVEIAFSSGAHGVFVINHGVGVVELFSLISAIRERYPDRWIGANFLGYDADEVFYPWPPPYVNGVWTDDLHGELRENVLFDGLYFGAFAFKSGRRVPFSRHKILAAMTVPYTDVLTTSGNRTGKPPTVAKVRRIREAIGDHPLAIASGITPENARKFLPYTNAFLVSTGISSDFIWLDEIKTRRLVEVVEDWNASQR